MFAKPTEQDFITRPGRTAPSGGPSNIFDVMGAAFTAESIETDRHAYMGRQIGDRYRGIWQRVVGAMGEDAAIQALEDRGLRTSRLRGGRPLYQSFAGNPQHARALLEIARSLHTDLNEGTLAIPATPLDLVREVEEDVRAEWEDAMGTLDMGLGSAAVAEFLGRGGAAMTDELSLLMLPLGAGGGSVARVALTEAALNGLAEAAILPRMYQQSADLDLPEPRPLEQIAMGAVFGGALGSAGELLARGVSYARLRTELDDIPADITVAEAQAAVEAAVEALEAGRPVPPILREESAVAAAASLSVSDSTDAVELSQLFPTERQVDEEIAQLRSDFPELGSRTPTLDFLRVLGKSRARRLGSAKEVIVPTDLTAELSARGVARDTVAGLFNTTRGIPDVDRIEASAFANGGTSRLPTDETGMYVDRDALIEAIAEEAKGGTSFRTAEAARAAERIAELEDEFASIRREMNSAAAAEGVPEHEHVRGWLEPPREGDDALKRALRAEADVENYSADLDTPLPRNVQQRAMVSLSDQCGSVEDAVQRAWMDEIEAGLGATVPSQRASEVVTEGRPRLEAATPREDTSPYEGLFADLEGLNTRRDDPTSDAATEAMDALEAELRASIDEFADVEVELERQTVSARSILDELAADRRHLEAIEMCSLPNRTAKAEL